MQGNEPRGDDDEAEVSRWRWHAALDRFVAVRVIYRMGYWIVMEFGIWQRLQEICRVVGRTQGHGRIGSHGRQSVSQKSARVLPSIVVKWLARELPFRGRLGRRDFAARMFLYARVVSMPQR